MVGANLAAVLGAAGHRVRCTRRATSRIDHLKELAIEWVEADLGDRDALARAFQGADAVFHCAARVQVGKTVTEALVRDNVEGTRNVLAAAARAGVRRVVHCSTIAALGVSTDGGLVAEDVVYNLAEHGLADGYSLTKRDAEKVLREAVKGGQDAVIVNLPYMFGPYDARPSSGKMIVDLVKRRLPGYTAGYNCFADVRDVCRGMLAAFERGRAGESYILGGHNMTYGEIFRLISAVAGVAPPRIKLPRFIGKLLEWALDFREWLTGSGGNLNATMVRYGYSEGFRFSSEKAKRELGYAFGPLEPSVSDALEWFRAQRMLD